MVIQDTVSPDHFGIDIRKQGKGYALFFGKFSEHLAVVIRNGIDFNASRLELLIGIAQLPELRPARGSPDSGAIKDDGRLRRTPIGMKVDDPPCRIGQLKIR